MSSAIDFKAIAEKITSGFTGITPPTDADAASLVTHLLPENIVQFPTILIFPFLPSQWSLGGGSRTATLDWPVRMFFDKAMDLPTRFALMYAWLPLMDLQFPTASNIDLNLGYTVRWAASVATPVIRTYTYNQIEWPVIETNVTTHVGEPLS